MTPLFYAILLTAVAMLGNPSREELGSIEQTYYSLTARRALQLARLNEYADRGVFPRNKDFPGKLVPYFVDEVATACAVGHLMQLDGKESLVASIASSANHIRIEDVDDGPLLNWIRDSGLTKDECALIQPSYATIEDYRRGRAWKDEIARLQTHFSKVEETLLTQAQLSLRKALIAKVDAQLSENPDDPALGIDALSKDLRSREPNVRIAAAHAIAQISQPGRGARLTALEPNLSDSDPEVRFWTAIAIQEIGAASPRGEMELYSRTLPVLLEVAQNSQNGLRLAALIQVANTAPITMGTNRQLRIMPEIRQTLVHACEDENRDIRQFARSVLRSWRWQRCVYESQRIRRQYLAASADLEALATETLAAGREFSVQPKNIESIIESRSLYDIASSITYLLPVATEASLPIAATADEVKQIVDDYFRSTYEKYRDQSESPWPFWEIVSAEVDKQGLYYVVVVVRTDSERSPKLIYVVPCPTMLSEASSLPYYWFDREDAPISDPIAGRHQVTFLPNKDAEVVLGNLARNDLQAFATTCDVFAYFLAHHSQLVIDREVHESADKFVWTGRFAWLSANNPRFFGEGVGPSTFSGGGWDFHRLSFECDRTTGRLDFSAERIEYPIAQLSSSILSPAWVTQEYKLMGWKPFESIDFFGDEPMPPEYHDAIEVFKPEDAGQARTILYRRYIVERCLPPAELVLGLLYERAGRREDAVRHMKSAAGSERYDPNTLAQVARWELSVGLRDDARKHAEAALALWPEQPRAKDVIRRLGEVASGQ